MFFEFSRTFGRPLIMSADSGWPVVPHVSPRIFRREYVETDLFPTDPYALHLSSRQDNGWAHIFGIFKYFPEIFLLIPRCPDFPENFELIPEDFIFWHDYTTHTL